MVLCEPEGNGNISDHWIQRGNSGPGQEDVSNCVGRRWTEEHETQLEVRNPHKQTNKQTNKQTTVIHENW